MLKLSFGLDQDAAESIKHIQTTSPECLQVSIKDAAASLCLAVVETRHPTETDQFLPDQSRLCDPQRESNRWRMFPSFLLPLRNLSNEISIWWIIVVRQKQMFVWWCSFEACVETFLVITAQKKWNVIRSIILYLQNPTRFTHVFTPALVQLKERRRLKKSASLCMFLSDVSVS